MSKIDDGGFSPAFVDEQLEKVMRAAGSSLRHYMPSSKDRMREAMRHALLAAILRARQAAQSGQAQTEARG